MCTTDECGPVGVVEIGSAGSNTAFGADEKLRAIFDFDAPFLGNNYPSLSRSQQSRFKSLFVEEFLGVLKWLRDNHWLDAALPPRPTVGPYQPQTDFHISVSDAYALSMSLVQAWSGQRGWIQFPAYRAVAGNASVAHEITHVLFPNGNRFLAEGLAVYLQGKVSSAPVYPNFGQPLDDLVNQFLGDKFLDDASKMLWEMDLDAFDRISTPDELGLRFGGLRGLIVGAQPGAGIPAGSSSVDPEEGKALYEVAGSLVGFLLDNPIEDSRLTKDNFRALYLTTPLRPFERNSGDPGRWSRCYEDYSFHHISMLWKRYMHDKFFPGEPVPANAADR